MARKSSISFKKRDEVDETYVFPVLHESSTFATRNSTLMIDYQADGTVLIIAGKIPGMAGYYKNYPDVVEDDEEKQAQHELAHCLLDEALEYLSEYDPETDYSKANSGNRTMRDIYVEVSEDKRDEVVLKMWKVLNYLREKYIEFIEETDLEDYRDYPSLEEEIIAISRGSDLSENDACDGWRGLVD